MCNIFSTSAYEPIVFCKFFESFVVEDSLDADGVTVTAYELLFEDYQNRLNVVWIVFGKSYRAYHIIMRVNMESWLNRNDKKRGKCRCI